MLKDSKSYSGFSVDDLQKAEQFYSVTLGLKVTKEHHTIDLLRLHLTGGGSAMIYPKANHVPAGYTILNFPVENIEATVKELKDKGVKFESYDNENLKTDENNIARGNGPVNAWFTDPAGNILAIIEIGAE
jgi:catechol 2,3-dioxygenase-like lactoylglutathione lyase family enzyme